MKHSLPILFIIILFFAFSCDTYDHPEPEPVEVIIVKPGVVQFTIQQWSKGKEPRLIVDSMFLKIVNQSDKTIQAVEYSLRGFKNNLKEYQNFDYWFEGSFTDPILINDAGFQRLSNSFKTLIDADNFEVDLISYKSGNNLIEHQYSGSYKGTYTVMRDSVFLTYGQHYSWIDYNGSITSYFDRQNFPWKSLRGQIVNDSSLYGKLFVGDTTINIVSSYYDKMESLFVSFDFKTDTLHTYQMSMTLNKN